MNTAKVLQVNCSNAVTKTSREVCKGGKPTQHFKKQLTSDFKGELSKAYHLTRIF